MNYHLKLALLATVLTVFGLACQPDEEPLPPPDISPSDTFRPFDVPPNLAWQIPLQPDSSRYETEITPLLAGELILYITQSQSTTTAGEAVVAVDQNGTEQWRWQDYTASLRSNQIEAAAVADGTLVVQTGGQYYGIDAQTGTTRWYLDMAGGRAPLVPFEDRVYQRFDYYPNADGDGGQIRYLDAATGQWTTVAGQYRPSSYCSLRYSPPAVERNATGTVRVYYTVRTCTPDGDAQVRYHAFNESTGQNDFRHVHDAPGSLWDGAPLLADSALFVVYTDRFIKLHKATGQEVWQTSTAERFFVDGSHSYVLTDAALLCSTFPTGIVVERETGAVSDPRNGWPSSYRIAGAAPYYVVSDDEVLGTIHPQTGQTSTKIELFNRENGYGHPHAKFETGVRLDAARDRLYVSDGYYLIALELPL